MPTEDPVAALRRLGGCAGYAALLGLTTRARLRTAVRSGAVLRPAEGTYVLPDVPPERRLAAAVGGVLSHLSAATEHGLSLVTRHDTVDVTVSRHARPQQLPGIRLHWAELSRAEVDGPVTTPVRTVLDCASSLPFAEALAVADSALRLALLTSDRLVNAALATAGPGRRRHLAVARAADHRAANAFESVLRSIVIEAGVTGFVPQLPIQLGGFVAHADLADPCRRVVLEGDSFTHHGTPAAFALDCERYDELVARGWLVLRFSWQQVMTRREWVAQTIRATCADR